MAQPQFKDEYMFPENYSDKIVNDIKKYISKNDCPNLSMDISHLNIIDASKVTVLCSTYHWEKYPDGKISCRTNSSELKDLVYPLNLGNISFITPQ